MAMIKNYNKLKTEYIKLKEAVGKIKAEISNDISSLGSTHETMTVGLKDALDTINLYTEGLI